MAGKHGFNQILTFTAKGKANFSSMKTQLNGLRKNFLAYAEAVKKGKDSTKAFKNLVNSLKDTGATAFNKMRTAAVGLTKAIGVGLVAAITAATVKFKSMVSEGMELAKVQYTVESNVKTIFGEAGLSQAKEITSALQSQGTIGDEKWLQAVQSMGAAGMDMNAINALLPVLGDIAVAKNGLDVDESLMQSLGDTMAKAVLTGKTTALIEYLPNLDQAAFKKADQQTRMAMLYSAAQSANILGADAALAQTDMGRTQQIENTIGDYKEELGQMGFELKRIYMEALEPYLPKLAEAGKKIMEGLKPVAETLAQFIGESGDAIADGVLEIANWFKNNTDKISAFFGFLWENKGKIATAIAAFAAFGIITDIIIKGIVIFQTLGPVLSAIGTVMPEIIAWFQLLPEMIAAGPAILAGLIPMAIGAIAALGVTIVAGINKWITDTFGSGEELGKKIGSILWKVVQKALELLLAALKGLYTFLLDVFDANNIGELLLNILKEAIKFFFITLPGILVGIWEGFWEGFADAISGLNLFGGLFGGNTDSNATGTPYAHGVTTINERGGEIMRLPSGTTIIPADKSAAMLSGKNVSVVLNVQGNVIGNKEFMEECGEYIYNRTKLALIG